MWNRRPVVQSLSTELTPISFEENPDFGRSDGGGGEYGKMKSNGERGFLSFFSD